MKNIQHTTWTQQQLQLLNKNPGLSLSRKKKDAGGKDKDDVDESQDTNILADTQPTQKDEQEARSMVDLGRYRAYFRELDMDVFTVLSVGLITKAALDTEMNTKVKLLV